MRNVSAFFVVLQLIARYESFALLARFARGIAVTAEREDTECSPSAYVISARIFCERSHSEGDSRWDADRRGRIIGRADNNTLACARSDACIVRAETGDSINRINKFTDRELFAIPRRAAL